MKKVLLLVALLLAVTASPVMAAAGVNLTWDNKCWSDGGVLNKEWSCNSNTGGPAGILSLSFETAVGHTDFVAIGFYLEGMSQSSTLPDWWKLGSGECRDGAVSMNTNFTMLTTVCEDLWKGQGGGGIGLYSDDTNRMHLTAAWALAAPITLEPGVEYICGQFSFSRAKTVGTGACGGCIVPAVWGIDRLELGFLNSPTEFLGFGPSDNGCVLWQNCSFVCRGDATRNTTWGQVKSLYR